MKRLFPTFFATLALLVAAPIAHGQTAPAPVAYTGPRYPGGPDSLRALVFRSTRLATPAPTGRMLVQFELQDGRTPRDFKLIDPPKAPKALRKASETALAYLQARMPAWKPGTPDADDQKGSTRKVHLVLDFATPAAAQPYAYAEQLPTFPNLTALLQAQRNPYLERSLSNPKTLARLASAKGLTTFMQLQVKYPPAAMRAQEQGTVYLYFEVAESGAIEQRQILGTAGSVLDDEVLSTAARLPAATAPAVLQGRPARVFQVIPISYRLATGRP
ncbi:energy transducer TonB [Hymenobacter ruricola]|uniref:TonB family protein n=1 Tax=Hymenobacter ruricola TaxID=2791023 RepID=A0ABS0I9P3_9BACT|nr:energy transducer TonB [Hymenobacter ruricola]MBF9223675.1 TonB family protein [Hymenobacter ruricola]